MMNKAYIGGKQAISEKMMKKINTIIKTYKIKPATFFRKWLGSVAMLISHANVFIKSVMRASADRLR